MTLQQTIVDRFLAQVKLTPNAVAIRSASCEISYADLSTLSSNYAAKLHAQLGASNKSNIVAIMGRRSSALIIAVLACARSGLAFAVIDSSYPKARILKMLEFTKPNTVLGVDYTMAELNNLCTDYINESGLTASLITINQYDLRH